MTDNKCRPVSLKRQPHLTGRKPEARDARSARPGRRRFLLYRGPPPQEGRFVMSQKSCFLAALTAIWYWLAACPRLAASPPKPPPISYQIEQLDLVDQYNVSLPGQRRIQHRQPRHNR